MPSEVKQRKRSPNQKPGAGAAERPAAAAARDGAEGTATPAADDVEPRRVSSPSPASVDVKTFLCVLSLAACAALTRVVLQQNERFSELEQQYTHLNGRTAALFNAEEEVLKVSEKLAASEDDLQDALSTASLAAKLQRDVSALHAAVAAIQADENSASRELQTVNTHFLNVTETWQVRLAAIAFDLDALKAESRDSHAGATERVNEAERRARSLDERLEELGDSTRRNARALERTEEEDAKRARDQLDWNTRQIHKLEEKVGLLAAREAEVSSQLQEHIPKAEQCEEHLPVVEDAVRSILRLGGDLNGVESRLEEMTLQLFGTEDSMLKALNEILELRQELDALHAHNSILKMKNELSVVKEAVHELTMVLRGDRADGREDQEPLGLDGDVWTEVETEDEEWTDYAQDDPFQSFRDEDLTQ